MDKELLGLLWELYDLNKKDAHKFPKTNSAAIVRKIEHTIQEMAKKSLTKNL